MAVGWANAEEGTMATEQTVGTGPPSPLPTAMAPTSARGGDGEAWNEPGTAQGTEETSDRGVKAQSE